VPNFSGRNLAIAAAASILGFLLFPPWIAQGPRNISLALGHGLLFHGPALSNECPRADELDLKVAKLRASRESDIAKSAERERSIREFNDNSTDGTFKCCIGEGTPEERVDKRISEAAEGAKRARMDCEEDNEELRKRARIDYGRLFTYVAAAFFLFVLLWLIRPKSAR
jgi:hypothetical protein